MRLLNRKKTDKAKDNPSADATAQAAQAPKTIKPDPAKDTAASNPNSAVTKDSQSAAESNSDRYSGSKELEKFQEKLKLVQAQIEDVEREMKMRDRGGEPLGNLPLKRRSLASWRSRFEKRLAELAPAS